jgi:hypothetical protein
MAVTYSLHLGLNEELQVVDVGTSLDVVVPRDVGIVALIELVGEGTLEVGGRQGKEVLGDLLANGDGSDLSAMMRLAVGVRGVERGVGVGKGA